jgi:lipopolysaccharide export system permease protein
MLDVTLLFLGLPIVVSRESRNAFISAGSCLLVVAGFLAAVAMFQGLGMNYLVRPALAAWAPLLLFVPMATWMSDSLRR